MQTISVFGLGKVGLTLAACLAEADFQVLGLDASEEVLDSIRYGRACNVEHGVAPRVHRMLDRNLALTSDPEKAVCNTDVTFVIVPTPSNDAGGFSLRYVRTACEQIGQALRRKDRSHTVAVVSTMLPGSSEHIVIPLLEQASGRKIGEDLGYCYNPAFIALGEVVQGFIQPSYVLVGESHPSAGDQIIAIHHAMVTNQPPVACMTPSEAEVTKIACNTHETMRVSFANMLLSLCNEIPGARVDRITEALTHRMGRRFFRGAVPYGGPCWPRDNVALSVFMDALGVPSAMPRTVDQFNTEHGKYLSQMLLDMTNPGDHIGLIGLAYKPGTPVIEHAFGVALAGLLAQGGRTVTVWDSLAMPNTRAVLGDRVSYVESVETCVNQAQTVVIVNPLQELAEVNWEKYGNRVVVDFWRCLTSEQTHLIADYRPIGNGPTDHAKTLLDKIGAQTLNRLTE